MFQDKFHKRGIVEDDSVFVVLFVAAPVAIGAGTIHNRANGGFKRDQRQGTALEGERLLHNSCRGGGRCTEIRSRSSLLSLFPRREILLFLLALHHGLLLMKSAIFDAGKVVWKECVFNRALLISNGLRGVRTMTAAAMVIVRWLEIEVFS